MSLQASPARSRVKDRTCQRLLREPRFVHRTVLVLASARDVEVRQRGAPEHTTGWVGYRQGDLGHEPAVGRVAAHGTTTKHRDPEIPLLVHGHAVHNSFGGRHLDKWTPAGDPATLQVEVERVQR